MNMPGKKRWLLYYPRLQINGGEHVHEGLSRTETMANGTPSDRSFGLVFVAFFLIVGLLPLWHGGSLRGWALAVAAAFLILALAMPRVLAPLNRLWMRFGMVLHRIVGPVALGAVFFGVVTPIGLLMRILGKNPLPLRFNRAAGTYWIDRAPPGPTPESLKNQF